MKPNAFIEHLEAPSEALLVEALGPAKVAWDALLAELATLGLMPEWHSYSRKAGWALRLKKGKRNILYLSPCAGSFLAAFILGDKALAALRAGGPGPRILDVLERATRYPEGTGLRFETVEAGDLQALLRLTEIKLKH
jgi:hypothetical protein